MDVFSLPAEGALNSAETADKLVRGGSQGVFRVTTGEASVIP